MRSLGIILLLLIILLPIRAFAIEILTVVHSLNESVKNDEPTLVFLASGQIAKLSSGNQFKQSVMEAKSKRQWMKFTLDEKREITSVASHEDPNLTEFNEEKSLLYSEKPSVINSMELAQKFFSAARYKDKESQCFNRAHLWSYEWKKKNYLNTAKIFIFFTPRYIREHDFHWWFHVAPYVHVAIGPEIKERVMDRKYLKQPSSIKQWVETFMEKGSKCRTVKVYTDYANYPEAGDCYLIRSSMFTYWPLDLELEELNGTKKTSWVESEVQSAYADALEINNEDTI